MMISSSPGIRHLAKSLPRLCLPVVVALSATFLLDRHTGIRLPIWTCAFALPLSFAVRLCYNDYANSRTAKRLNAVLTPRAGDPTPGGLRTLYRFIQSAKLDGHGYPGDVAAACMAERGNTVNFRMLFEDRIVTTEPEYIKNVLATQFDQYEKGPTLRNAFEGVLGTGVFASDGDNWKFHRAMTRPFFTKDRISHFEIFDRHADEALCIMKERFKEGFPVNFQDIASRFTLDSATEFLFGQNFRSLSSEIPYPFYRPSDNSGPGSKVNADTFADAFGRALLLTNERLRIGDNWPLAEFWKDKMSEELDVIKEFLNPVLAEAVEKKNDKVAAGELDPAAEIKGREVQEGETLLDHLVNCTEDQKILLDEIMNVSIAGRDTTASILTSVVYMLSQHPDVLARVRGEILSKVGPSKQPNFDDLRDMKYLRAVINETLRLYPPVPFNVRECKNGSVWPATATGGAQFYIPPGVRIIYSVFLMHRREDLWGPDAQQFDPDRFIDERVRKYLTPNPFIFLPFNAGPRICLGQQFAYNEVSFFLVRLLQAFSEISFNSDALPPQCHPPASWKEEGGVKAQEKIRLKQHLTLYIYGGLWVDMKSAT